MKIMVSFLSAVIFFLGIIPFFGDSFPIPNKGIGYSIILLGLGLIIIASSLINNLLMGIEKFFLILQGTLLLGVALLHFLPTFLVFLPRDGIMYTAMVLVIGALGLLYGLLGMG